MMVGFLFFFFLSSFCNGFVGIFILMKVSIFESIVGEKVNTYLVKYGD